MSKSPKTRTQSVDEGGTATMEAVQESTTTPPCGCTSQVQQQEVAAWQTNKKINGLWGKNQPRNTWISISGVGWKRLANTSDSATLALTILATAAMQSGSPVNYREEADQMIHEIYVW